MLTQEVSIAGRIRARLDAGELPRRVPTNLPSSPGSGMMCDGCGQPILNAQSEHQIETDRSYHFHIGCSAVWRAEVLRHGN